jgi:hypothetical protein
MQMIMLIRYTIKAEGGLNLPDLNLRSQNYSHYTKDTV